ncbi:MULTISPECIES: DUF2726 domain-containing protein [Nitrosomonas]|uniref:Uncharacterized protein DUF2726 n=1 Tax=Nitrosomonas communis TaxID=44574 RepID=A0A0F7KFK1_9PROT|nr:MULTISPECIES: DUF2726 domain-containing protein [Nitrosomonas]AKH38256.1 hypothetical protein AAW31_11355 [Nitrosomonas communis]TYP89502.1 uncharacterized protein DUF2726 [Nitrosomonas communis]UVS60234.1 DUF2726 domain-containing protein [Nitrosomonas sp. PLL12]
MELQNIIIIGFASCFVLILLLKIFYKKSDRVYYHTKALFTPAERSFFGVLSQAVSNQYLVFGKVRIADVVGIKKASNNSVRQIAFNKMASKHFDYVLCTKDTLSVVAVIELDDKSHLKEKTIHRDSLVENICRNADLTLIRFNVKASYQISAIKNKITASLNSSHDEL